MSEKPRKSRLESSVVVPVRASPKRYQSVVVDIYTVKSLLTVNVEIIHGATNEHIYIEPSIVEFKSSKFKSSSSKL